ncbi:superoxide dismutase [Mn], mitochondrial [Lingula anatina]|uniref:Superoxide dismutase n=1 Tax=Lingula anatina TaxID=7574 RepID=A0A1S3K2S7_LINAN|nr:superoxide dismutase [Mn], mitochondrial [Lingula anatina]|eukprot:XP_013416561.1 superoxide dismutase [Mn], mitochondrial [Lingula anatina]
MLCARIGMLKRFVPQQKAALGFTASRLAHSLPDLPYDFNALEPVIGAEIMEIHYKKHHATYVNNLNIAEEKMEKALAEGDTNAAISLLPALNFNGGGHINHSIFWTNLSPNGGGEPTGDLKESINRDFGGFESMKKELISKTVAIQGSGWGWLGYNPHTQRLRLAVRPNQDSLFPTLGLIPLLGIDVWEHAYYLQYKNDRGAYVNAIWNIINWDNVADRYANARMQN